MSMGAKLFAEDCRRMFNEAARAGRLSRRQLLAASALAGVVPLAGGMGRAFAQDKPEQIVHANWGGDAVHCNEETYGAAFTDSTGVKVVIDGSGPMEGTIQQMVESGATIWDCCDSDLFTALRLLSGAALLLVDPELDETGVLSFRNAAVEAWNELAQRTPAARQAARSARVRACRKANRRARVARSK